jgi:hypothetical protein
MVGTCDTAHKYQHTTTTLEYVSKNLMLACVEVEHVEERDDISVLVAIDDNADLVEEELDVKARHILASAVVHDDLRSQYKHNGDMKGLPVLLGLLR